MNGNAKNILIVDDNPDICEVVKLILLKAGYHAKAVEHFEPFKPQEAPDLILLDIRISEQDGTEICRQLKEAQDTCNIPIIMFSASHEVEEAAFKAGADDFIAKPFQIKDLLWKIEHIKKAA